MHHTIVNNIMYLLQTGAFGSCSNSTYNTLMPMSPYKWRQLIAIAEELHIARFVKVGAKMVNDNIVMSQELLDIIQSKDYSKEEEVYFLTEASTYNRWSNNRLEDIREEEMNAQETSEETLMLLDHIIRNAALIISDDISISGIIELGYYIRDNQKKIDYEKLSSWLRYIGIVQIASLEGNILVEGLGFSKEEIPFIKGRYSKTKRMLPRRITQSKSGSSISAATLFNVAMLQTISQRVSSSISKITNIEE